MILRIERRVSVGEFLADMERRHGNLRGFRAYVGAHPRDVNAKLDLEDFEFFLERPGLRNETMVRGVSLIPVTDQALSMFTKRRLAILEALALRSFESVRQLAADLHRDVHNVHADLQLFRALGLVEFDRGSGRRLEPRLAGDSIRIDVSRPHDGRDRRRLERHGRERERTRPLEAA